MAGIESFEARRVLSVGNGGIHAVVEHEDIDKNGNKKTIFLSLGTMSNFVGGTQYSYNNHYVNGSHLAVGETQLGVFLSNARFIFDKIDEDVCSALNRVAKIKGVNLFKEDQVYETAFRGGSTTLVDANKKSIDTLSPIANKITDYSLDNIKKPLKITLFSTVDYCNEIGVPDLKNLNLGTLNIDGDLKYNVLVKKVVTDVIFSKSSTGGAAINGASPGSYDAICGNISPWQYINTATDGTFSPLTLSSSDATLYELLK